VKILVTVGSTRYDELIKVVDTVLVNENYDVEMQIADGKYIPINYKYFTFIENIREYYERSDIVITHAGAGTIYELLELEKKIIIVPNLDRADNHQIDIARYMDENGYATTLWKCEDLIKVINEVNKKQFIKMTKEQFFKTDEIIEYMKNNTL